MSKAKYNFSIYKGVDAYLPLSFFQETDGGTCCGYPVSDTETEAKTAVNFARAGVIMTMVDYSGEIVDSLSTQNGRIKLGTFKDGIFTEFTEADEVADVICIAFPHSVTEGYEFNKAAYDLILIRGEGEIYETRELILSGKVALERGVTYAR
jgi:hypothetical protein